MISIIIPVYNLEHYIDQCLNTVLSQTFKNYEVIIVDDCSTDKTLDVVEKFLPRFDGKFKIHQLQKNSNDGGATPKNLGLKFSRGKYVLFLDGDDLLISTALENFHNAAEAFSADLVFTEKFYQFNDRGLIPDQNELHLHNQVANPVDKPTLVEDDLAEKIRQYIGGKIIGFHWNKIMRRDFLIEHGIEFSKMPVRHDAIFSFECFCLARSVKIPDSANIYRLNRLGSHSQRSDLSEDKLRLWIRDTLLGAKELYDFSKTVDFFDENVATLYDVIRWHLQSNFNLTIKNSYRNFSPDQMFSILMEEFSKDPAGFLPISAVVFNMANGR